MSDNDDLMKLPDIRDLLPRPKPPRFIEFSSFHPPPADQVWRRHKIPDLIQDQMGLTDQEAAVAALSAPVKWDNEETETLESVLAGEQYNRDTLADLVEKMMNGEPEINTEPEPHQMFQAAIKSYDNEGPLSPEPPPVTGNPSANLPDMGSIDVGDWWNK